MGGSFFCYHHHHLRRPLILPHLPSLSRLSLPPSSLPSPLDLGFDPVWRLSGERMACCHLFREGSRLGDAWALGSLEGTLGCGDWVCGGLEGWGGVPPGLRVGRSPTGGRPPGCPSLVSLSKFGRSPRGAALKAWHDFPYLIHRWDLVDRGRRPSSATG